MMKIVLPGFKNILLQDLYCGTLEFFFLREVLVFPVCGNKKNHKLEVVGAKLLNKTLFNFLL
jgi:hypothetical protein